MATTPHVLIDRYEVGRLLGAGGMAEVFEGRDRLLARRVAIKVLLAQYARDPAFLIRFKREAQAAASLSHPNIVAVYDTGAEAGTQFIVMEYVEGRTLREVLRAEGPLLAERAAEVAVEVCAALAAAHARGLIHRDIKPGNVMLTPAGAVKVMDFGIARAASGESITQTSAVLGTAQYIAPEQAQGQPVDCRSDVYSLGCCVFEMVTGVVPFSGSTPVAIAYRHVREAPTPPRVLNPDVPAGLEAVVLKAMAKQPGQRYQTAAELRQDLERFLAGRGVLATPTPDARDAWSPGGPAGAAARTGTGGSGVGTAAGGAAGAAAGGAAGTAAGGAPGPGSDAAATSVLAASRSRPAASRSRPRVSRRRPRRAVPGWAGWIAAVLLLAVPVAVFMVRSIGGTGAPARTTLAPLAVDPDVEPFETVAPTTTRLATTTNVPSTTAPATTPTTAPATTAGSRPALVRVPEVVGLRAARANVVLTEAGFTVRRVDVLVRQRSRAGRVLLQTPGAGAQAPAGSQVVIAVGTLL